MTKFMKSLLEFLNEDRFSILHVLFGSIIILTMIHYGWWPK